MFVKQFISYCVIIKLTQAFCFTHNCPQYRAEDPIHWHYWRPGMLPPPWKRTKSWREKYLDWRPQWPKVRKTALEMVQAAVTDRHHVIFVLHEEDRTRGHSLCYTIMKNLEVEIYGYITTHLAQSNINFCRLKVLFQLLSHFRDTWISSWMFANMCLTSLRST